MKSRIFATILMVIFLAGVAGCGLRKTKRNLVFITVDGLSTEILLKKVDNKPVMPFLNHLKDEGVFIGDILPSSLSQFPYYASLFTGKYPVELGIRFNWIQPLPESQPSFVTVIKERFYNTAAFTNNPFLGGKLGLSKGFDLYDDHLEQVKEGRSMERKAEDLVLGLSKWLGGEGKPPFFTWISIFDLHRLKLDIWAGNRFPETDCFEKAAEIDRALEKLFNFIKSQPYGKDTIFCILGSSGFAGGKGVYYRMDYSMDSSLTGLPLILSFPGKPGKVKKASNNAAFSSIDILPTILGLLDIKPGSQPAGIDIMVALKKKNYPPNRVIYSENTHPQLLFGWEPLYLARNQQATAVKGYLDTDGEQVSGTQQELSKNLKDFFKVKETQYLSIRYDDALTEEKLKTMISVGNLLGEKPVGIATAKLDETGLQQFIDGFSVVSGLFSSKDYDKCVEECGKLLKLDPSNIAAAFIMVQAYNQSNKPAQAEKVLLNMLFYYPKNPFITYLLTENYLRTEKLEKAKQVLDELIDDTYRSSFAVNIKAKMLDWEGDHEGAIKLLESVSAKRGLTEEELIMLGNSYIATNNTKKALQSFELAWNMNKWNEEAVFNLGLLNFHEKQFQRSVYFFQSARSLNPQNPVYSQFLARSLLALGKAGEAISILKNLLQLSPQNMEIRYDLAKAYLGTDNVAEAEKLFNKILKYQPSLIIPHIDMANYYLDKNNTAEAMKKYNLAKKSYTLHKNQQEKPALEALEKRLKEKGLLK